jgi:hypothetical protein
VRKRFKPERGSADGASAEPRSSERGGTQEEELMSERVCTARWLPILALALLASCATTKSRSGLPFSTANTSPWLQPSPLLAQQIEDEATRLPWTHDLERVEQIRWFVSVGEPAYAKLLQLAVDARDDVAAAAIAALGGSGDRRLVMHLKGLPWNKGPVAESSGRSRELELELGRALVSLGDWSSMPVLIAGLREEKAYVRALCLQVLQRSTRQTFGFDPRGEPDRREEAVLRWEGWWKARSSEGLLANTQPPADAAK